MKQQPWGKRGLDLLLLALAAPVCIPVAAAVALAIRWQMGCPILFRQERAGLNGRPFTLLKFRTMAPETGSGWDPSTDGARLTPLGRRLRRWSLDELPQLWNIARGDMSWIGPRPLPLAYLPRYNATQSRRHDVVPGLTGWAQVNGRNATTWPDRLRMDVWYAGHASLPLDLKILVLTVKSVLGGRGVSSAESATMHEFRGEA